MARYFFDVRQDGILSVDTEGTELADAEAARIEAVEALAELAHSTLPGSTGKHLEMRVHDGTGGQAFELDLVFKLTRTGPQKPA